MWRSWLIPLLCVTAALSAIGAPAGALAQTRSASRSDTRGSTRRASRSRRSRSQRSRGRASRDDPRRSRRRWHRRRRRRRRIVGTYDPSSCDYVRDGYCYYVEYEYLGSSTVFLGFSLDAIGGVFPSNLNGLSSARVLGGDVDAGVLPTLGAGARAWLLYDRLRAGAIVQGGAAISTRGVPLRATDVFEEDSRTSDAWWYGVWGFGAYQPQLSDLVQLWLGARLGFHSLSMTVDWRGRSYDTLDRLFFSAGPEVGLMLSGDDGVGIMFWGFADLAQPGMAQLSVAFVYEQPKPRGAAF